MSSLNRVRLTIAVLLVALGVQILMHIVTTSPTFDEPYHITRSYVYLRTGDQALLRLGGHPPLANLLNVSPLLLRSGVRLPEHDPGWNDVSGFKDLFRVADEFFWRIGNDAESLTRWSRLPGILLSAALACLVFRWATQLNGVGGGLLALLLFAFDPNIIAHGGLVTTDLGAALFIFLFVYFLWWFCKRPGKGRLLATGVVFGLAQATKFSSLSLFPISLLLLVVSVKDDVKWRAVLPHFSVGASQEGRVLDRLQSALVLCGVIWIIGLVVLWAVYGFDVSPLLPHEDSHPLLDCVLPLSSEGARRAVYAIAERLPVPAPAYFAELSWLQRYAKAGHPSFLMGATGVAGWRSYFLIAFLIKTPIPLLLLLGAALWQSIRHRSGLQHELFLLVPMVLFFVSSVFSSIDIGYRNLLPLLPLAHVYAGKVAGGLQKRWTKAALLALCAWYVIGTVAISPHYLAYFNELIGGPANGYKYLVDSNLDWGQDLKHLKSYMVLRGLDEIYLSYFGTADPTYYGIKHHPFPAQPPSAGSDPAYYAISATNLQEVYSSAHAYAGWLAAYKPVDRVGYSIFIYHLP